MKHILLAAVCIAAYSQQAAPPTTVVFRKFLASQTGAILDCAPTNTTGAGCTDNTAVLNAVLAQATAANPILLEMDGFTATTGIVGPQTGYWGIQCEGLGTGFVVISGSNSYAIRNVPGQTQQSLGVTPGTPGSSIYINNCRINGNHLYNSTNSAAPQYPPGGQPLPAIYIENMVDFRTDGVMVYDAPGYAILLNSCSGCWVNNFIANQVTESVNQDGVHVDGPSSQIYVNNLYCNTGDDCIAINAAEGFGGNINGVFISGVQCNPCRSAYRQLSSEQIGAAAVGNYLVSNVVIHGVTGNITSQWGFVLGLTYSGSLAADIQQSVTITGSVLHGSSLLELVELQDNIGNLILANNIWQAPPASAVGLIDFNSAGLTASNIVFGPGNIIYRTGNSTARCLSFSSAATVIRADLTGCKITNSNGSSPSALAAAITVPSGSAITNLIPMTDFSNITALASSGDLARVTTIVPTTFSGNVGAPSLQNTGNGYATASLPTCNGTTNLYARVIDNDVLTWTPGVAPTGSGGFKGPVVCIQLTSGPTYGWVIE